MPASGCSVKFCYFWGLIHLRLHIHRSLLSVSKTLRISTSSVHWVMVWNSVLLIEGPNGDWRLLNYNNGAMNNNFIRWTLITFVWFISSFHSGTHALLLPVLLMQTQAGSSLSSLLVANSAGRGRVNDATPTVLSLYCLPTCCMKAVFQGCQKNSSSFGNNQRKAFIWPAWIIIRILNAIWRLISVVRVHYFISYNHKFKTDLCWI